MLKKIFSAIILVMFFSFISSCISTTENVPSDDNKIPDDDEKKTQDVVDDEEDDGVYEVGDIGPSGGYVFYVDDLENPLLSEGKTYLEAAPTDLDGTHQWSNITDQEIGLEAKGTAIGTGYANSLAIIGQVDHTESAASKCLGLDIDGTIGWYLPSKDELNAMYENLHLLNKGDFNPPFYWSSTEHDATFAEFQNFDINNPHGGANIKTDSSVRIRCIRAF